MKKQLIIPAAGSGQRLNQNISKALVEVGGAPLILQTLKCFKKSGLQKNAVIICPSEEVDYFRKIISSTMPNLGITFVAGGLERQQSVEFGLEALDEDTDIAVIHDAARPFLEQDTLDNVIHAAEEFGAATVAVPVIDTILQADTDLCLMDTPDRAALWACQTPQVFKIDIIRKAHEHARNVGSSATDDATLVQQAGYKVKLVKGTYTNFKITTPENLMNAELYVTRGNKLMRIGLGYDIHRLEEGKPLILGGIKIPHSKGMVGHSDADALCHAITDALLGALALGDIGTHFPDTAPEFKGADSTVLLRNVLKLVHKKGYQVANIDSNIIAQQPKLMTYIDVIRNSLADILRIEKEQISVKAKTNEKVDAVGREEAISTQAIVLLIKQDA